MDKDKETSIHQYVDQKFNTLELTIQTHNHDGNFTQRINAPDLFLFIEPTNVTSATIATTGNTDAYFIVPFTGKVLEISFSGTDALAANDTNYITWTITNLGQAGAGTAAFLAATDANTTKATGGTAIAANTKRTLTLTSTINDLLVVKGDRIRIRAAATGTLANTVTFPVYLIEIQ